jgi:hypothetical protein
MPALPPPLPLVAMSPEAPVLAVIVWAPPFAPPAPPMMSSADVAGASLEQAPMKKAVIIAKAPPEIRPNIRGS